MNSILITGANRGLGLGMVKYLIKEKKAENIFATCRQVSQELQQICNENANVHLLSIDLKNIADLGKIATQVQGITQDKGLNVLVNNAGVSTRFTKIQLVKEDQLMENLIINTVSPIMLTKTLLPLLKQAADRYSDQPVSVRRAAVINISSILGSIAKNDQGGFYPYRCSKAAINAATKSMSADLKKDNILVACMHPGWVKTDMGGKNAPLDVETSVRGMFETIENLREQDSGKFLQYDGTELPW